ncbi:MAG: rod-binding protein [Peptococcaceae bacterium]
MKIESGMNINSLQAANSKMKNSEDKFQQILKNAQGTDDKEKLMEACQQFESVFVHKMIAQMRAAIPEGGLIPKGQGEKIFQDMLDEQYAQKISKAGGMGLAKILYDQLSANLSNPPEEKEITNFEK